jgi:hypothetical protein
MCAHLDAAAVRLLHLRRNALQYGGFEAEAAAACQRLARHLQHDALEPEVDMR